MLKMIKPSHCVLMIVLSFLASSLDGWAKSICDCFQYNLQNEYAFAIFLCQYNLKIYQEICAHLCARVSRLLVFRFISFTLVCLWKTQWFPNIACHVIIKWYLFLHCLNHSRQDLLKTCWMHHCHHFLLLLCLYFVLSIAVHIYSA